MKIIYLHQYFNTPEMAGSTRSWEFARRLAREGHQVEMITTDREPGAVTAAGEPAQSHKSDPASRSNEPAAAGVTTEDPLWRVEEREGFRIHWTPIPYANELPNRERIKSFLVFAWRATHRIRQLGGDLIYASSTPLTIALPAIYGTRRLKIPMVFEVRDLWPHVPIAMGELSNPLLAFLAKRLERSAYRHAKHVVTLSPGMRDGVLRQGVDPSKVSVIPNNSDLELFSAGPEQGEQFRRDQPLIGNRPLVLYCGTLGRVNGVGQMVRIAIEMADIDPEIAFLIVGDGREKAQIERMARESGVMGQNLFMLPPVPKTDVPVLYAAADLTSSFVIDNKALWDNSANKFFDSLAAGKPILINHEGWQAQLLRETGAGLVVPPLDARQSAEQIQTFLQGSDRKSVAGQAAEQLARSRFAREQLFEELHHILTRAAPKKIDSAGLDIS